MIFYMGINVGAFFAPFVATGIRNWWLQTNGFLHDGSLPSLCHQMLNGTLKDTAQFQQLADKVVISKVPVTDLHAFAQQYIDVFARGYNWAFAIAAGAMIMSLIVYIVFNKTLPGKSARIVVAKKVNVNSDEKVTGNGKALGISILLMGVTAFLLQLIPGLDYKFGLAIGLFIAFVSYIFQISTKDERPRVTSLILVFVVVIFFWMSFHQNGLTLTIFARDYIAKQVGPLTNLFFNLNSILSVIATIAGLVLVFKSKIKVHTRIIGGVITLAAVALCYYFVGTYGANNPIAPEIFQSFNPLFIVALTPLVMGLFSYLNKKGIEPSTPKKIGFGMILASLGFVVVLIASLHVVSPYLLNGAATPDASRVSPYWLMSSYLILTVAELFLSPMGLSFVSKVAPPRFQGLMQGGWLLATAVGNKLLFVGSLLWGRIDLYLLWGVFFLCCIVSAMFIFSIMKRLERVTVK